MKTFHLKDMKDGWFIGNFSPTCLKITECEVACKYYKRGEAAKRHVHKVSTEITLILKGMVKINNVVYKTGNIIVLEPEEAADFRVLKDTITVVAKVPSVVGDKYFV